MERYGAFSRFCCSANPIGPCGTTPFAGASRRDAPLQEAWALCEPVRNACDT